MTDKKIYSLSNVTLAVERVINKYCNSTIWVRAEIVKLNFYKQSGHCYPDLVEKKDGKIIAEMRGNIWNSNFEQINAKFKKVLNEELGDNMVIVCLVTVKYSPVYGLALNITDIDPSYTLGELAKQKAETIKKLKEEKLFTLNKQKSLPKIPKIIAVISANTSKGYNDFLSVINNNSWKYKFHTLLFPAILQGERAVTSITAQLEQIKKHITVFDAVAILRGGGGEIGLSCYDDYNLAKNVANFPIPVLTGIGHSTNETVVEMISFRSFITPTKIAEFLIQEYHNFSVPIKEFEEKINNYASKLFEKERSAIKDTARLFNSITNRFLDNQKHILKQDLLIINNFTSSFLKSEKQNLKDCASSLQVQTSNFIQTQNSDLQNVLNNLKQFQERIISLQKSFISDFQKSISLNHKIILDKMKKEIDYIYDKILLLSPENILKRGFSITRINGTPIQDINEVKINDSIETEIFKGKIQSRVEKTQDKSNILLQWLKK